MDSAQPRVAEPRSSVSFLTRPYRIKGPDPAFPLSVVTLTKLSYSAHYRFLYKKNTGCDTYRFWEETIQIGYVSRIVGF